MAAITAPGIYPDISDAAYHQDPCPAPSLSCSIIDVLLERSPAHAKAKHPRLTKIEEPEEWKYNEGSAVHAILLHGMQAICEIDADSYRTNVAKEARDLALTQGLYPVLAPQLDKALVVCRAIQTQVDAHPLLAGVLDPDAGSSEVSVLWQEHGHGGIWARCKPDRLLPRRIIDFKVTQVAATPESWGASHAWKMGYARRAVWYQRGLHVVTGSWPIYQFCVIESEPPNAVSVFECSPEALDLAEREVKMALMRWATCMQHNIWPGYSNELQYINPPAWAHYRTEEVLARHKFSVTQDERQAPFIMSPGAFGV